MEEREPIEPEDEPQPGLEPDERANIQADLEDLDGIMRCIMWPEQFAEFGQHVVADAIVAIKGAVDRRPGAEEVNLIVNELIPLADLPARFTSGISVRVREEEHGIDALEKLREIVRGYPGSKPLKIHLLSPTAAASRSTARSTTSPSTRNCGGGSKTSWARRTSNSSPAASGRRRRHHKMAGDRRWRGDKD